MRVPWNSTFSEHFSISNGVVVLVRLSIWSSCLEIAEYPDGVHWSAHKSDGVSVVG